VILQISKELNIDEVSQYLMSRLRKKYHLNVDVQKRGSTFTKYTICKSLKDLMSKVGKNSVSAKEHELKLKRYNKHQKLCRHLYHSWKVESIQSKEEFLCIIHNKMDHSKTTLPRLRVKNKMVVGFGQLPIMLIGMTVYGHGDEAFGQYSNELWPNDLNFTIGFLLHLLRTLEKEPVRELQRLFDHELQNEFFE
jgi:hypothetical protein